MEGSGLLFSFRNSRLFTQTNSVSTSTAGAARERRCKYSSSDALLQPEPLALLASGTSAAAYEKD